MRQCWVCITDCVYIILVGVINNHSPSIILYIVCVNNQPSQPCLLPFYTIPIIILLLFSFLFYSVMIYINIPWMMNMFLYRSLVPVTQLYVSVDAGTKESLKKIDRPLFRDFWPRFISSLEALSEKVCRLILWLINLVPIIILLFPYFFLFLVSENCLPIDTGEAVEHWWTRGICITGI